MAKNSIRDFDATSGNNTDIQSVDISEGCAASGINNAIRELMTDLKNVSTGAVNLETPAADRLDVDNIRIDGNTISSTDTNGDITLDPNGTGDTIVASGNLAVGTSSPADELHVNATGANVNLRLTRDTNTGCRVSGSNGSTTPSFIVETIASGTATERMRIDQNGDVGINENSPDTLLHLTDTTANDGPVIRLEGSGNNAANNLIGGVEWKNSDGSGDGPTVTGAIRHYSSNSSGSGGYTTFHTHDGTEGGEGSDAVERMRIDKNGNVLMGATSMPTNGGIGFEGASGYAQWSRSGTGSEYAIRFYRNNSNSGNISYTNTSVTYGTSSDHRLKQGVEDMTGAIDRVKALAPKRFQFIADADTTVDGFLAHEAQTVVPEAVTGTHNEVDDDGNAVMQGIDQSKLVPLLTGALQEAITKIETLATTVAALEAAD